MSVILPILRPNSVTLQTRAPGTPSQTGSPTSVVTTTNSNVPALIDLGLEGEASMYIQGEVYVQDARLYLDGLRPSQFVGTPAGGTLVINGITYTVFDNALGAFPLLTVGDRVTDEHGTQYLVLAVDRYYSVFPVLEAAMSRGRAWGG